MTLSTSQDDTTFTGDKSICEGKAILKEKGDGLFAGEKVHLQLKNILSVKTLAIFLSGFCPEAAGFFKKI